jgi:phosphoserine phosphatase
MESLAVRPVPEPGLERADQSGTSHLITLTGRSLSAELLGAMLHRTSALVSRITGTRTMANRPYTVLEIAIQLDEPLGNAEAELTVALRLLADQCDADITLRRAGMRHSLVAFDVDATLIRGEAINQLAEHAGHGDEVRQVTERAMRGELDFAESLRRRVATLAGLPVQVLARIGAELDLTPGALVTVRTLQSKHIKVGLISGGFTAIIAPLAARLGLGFVAANELEVQGERLTGRVTGKIIDRQAKAAQLRRFAADCRVPMAECVAVGDGANDIDMITAAGFGIAFNAAPKVRAAANAVISYPRLDLVLPLLGIPVPFAVVGAGSPGGGGRGGPG